MSENFKLENCVCVYRNQVLYAMVFRLDSDVYYCHETGGISASGASVGGDHFELADKQRNLKFNRMKLTEYLSGLVNPNSVPALIDSLG